MLATAGKTYELRVGKGAQGSYRYADFSRRGQLLAVIPSTGGGSLMRARGVTFGDSPQLRNVPLPTSPNWHTAAFRHQVKAALEGREIASEELCVADGRVIQRFLVPLSEGQPVKELCTIESRGTQCLSYCAGVDSSAAGYDVLASGSADGTIRAWNLQGDRPRRIFENRVSEESITSIALDSTGQVIYYVTADGEPCRLEQSGHQSLRPSQRSRSAFPADFEAYTVACHPSEQIALFAGTGSDVWMFDDHQHGPVKITTQLGGFIRRISFLSKGLVAFFGERGTEFWSLEPFGLRAQCSERFGKVRSYSSQSGERALSGRVFCQTTYVVLS